MLIAKTFCFSRNARFFAQGNSTHKFSGPQSVHQVRNRNRQHRFSICTKSRNVQKVTMRQHNEKMLQNLHCVFSVACIHHGMSASHKSSVCLVAVVSARPAKLHLANNFQLCFWIMHVKSIKSFKRQQHVSTVFQETARVSRSCFKSDQLGTTELKSTKGVCPQQLSWHSGALGVICTDNMCV